MSKSASNNYKRGKTKKRTLPILNDRQIRQLVELLGRKAPYGEIATKLDVSDIDIDLLRKNLNIDTDEAIEAKLKEYAVMDIEAAQAAEDAREAARLRHQEAEARLDASIAKKELLDEAARARSEEGLAQRAEQLKAEDAQRQKLHELNKKKEASDPLAGYRVPSKYYVGAGIKKPVKSGASLPPNVAAEDFRQELLSRGIRFVCDKYNILPADIRNTITKLDLKLDFELLPR